MTKNYIKYNLIILVTVLLPLLIILLCNMLLYETSYDDSTIRKIAVEWQLRTKGVVSPPPNGKLIGNCQKIGEELFKILILNNKLPHINTLILGSSTVMGIKANMFPRKMRVYSFTHSTQMIGESLAEGNYFISVPNIKWLVVDLDWYLGYLYYPDSKEEFKFWIDSGEISSPHWLDKIKDALSIPRVKGLVNIIYEIIQAENKKETLKKISQKNFMGEDYLCPDGTPAKDFDRNYFHTCIGYNIDGSAAWQTMPHLDHFSLEKIIHFPFGDYYKDEFFSPFNQMKGIPNAEVLAKFANLSVAYKKKGGGIILVLPALPPNYEKSLLKNIRTSAYLNNTKRILNSWASQHGIIIIDAGQSENFNCTEDEFMDDHHAYHTCYAKIMHKFWSDYAHGLVKAGLYVPNFA